MLSVDWRHLTRVLFYGLLLVTGFPATAGMVGHGGAVTSIALSGDGRSAVTGGFDYSLILWNLDSQTLVRRLIGHDAAVTSVAFFGGDRKVVSGSDDGTAAIWDLETGTLTARLRGHRGKIASVAVSPDEKILVTGGWDRTVRLWSLETQKPLRVMRGHTNNVNGVAFSVDGNRILSASYDGTIKTWERDTGRLVLTIDSQRRDGVNALIALSDGFKLASVAIDETVSLWDIHSGENLGQFLGHDGPVLSVTASPGGKYLASGGMDGMVRVWKTDGAKAVFRRFVKHVGPVWSLAFSEDSQRLYSAGGDGIVRVWDVVEDKEILPSEPRPVEIAERKPVNHPGARVFRKCAICHTTTPDGAFRAGPTLFGLFGRRAGTVAGYPYSRALQNSEIVWTDETVSKLFEIGPDELTPGTKMPLQRIPKASDRALLVDYLKLITRHSSP